MYYDNVLKEEHTALRFPSFYNADGVQKLVACMPDDQPLGECELPTFEDMRWNDNHQCLIQILESIHHQKHEIVHAATSLCRASYFRPSGLL
jgi:hypothetical protein